METLTKTKSKEQIEAQRLAYLNKTSQHLFINKKGVLTKIIPLQINGKWFYTKIIFGNKVPQVLVMKVLDKSVYDYYGNNSLAVFKVNLFPPSGDRLSIPNFKRVRLLMDSIRLELNKYTDDKDINDEINKIIINIINESNII